MRAFAQLVATALAAALLAGSAWAQAPQPAPAAAAAGRSASPAPAQPTQALVASAWWTQTGSELLALRAEPAGVPRLRLYGASQAFSAESGHTQANLEIGAGVCVVHRARLTASYRMLGFDLGSSLGQFDSDVTAPFLGIALDF